MERKSTVQSITYIISGELLQLAGSIGNGWVSNIVVIIGLVFFFQGLSALKVILDENGKKGVSLLSLAAIVGLIASLFDFIPLMGIFASLLFMVSFVLQILGFLQLSKSNSIGTIGKSGTQLMFVSMALAIVAAIFGIIPFVGGFMGGLFAIGALLCGLFGWMRLQEGILGRLN
jgi:hypothetical protein